MIEENAIFVTINASDACASAALQRKYPGWRVWAIPDNVPKFAVTFGGTETGAHCAVVAALREKFIGDWSYSATEIHEVNVRPCAWCERHNTYAH